MPRAKKTAEQRKVNRDRERILTSFWSARIKAGQAVKRDYVENAKEVTDQLKAQHSLLYNSPQLSAHFVNFQGSTQVSVPVVVALKNSMAPRLYLAKPRRNVLTRASDPVMIALCRTVQAYLNYSTTEANFAKELRQAIDDSLLRGRGFLRQGWDEVRRVVTSNYLSSLDVVFDPDYTSIKDAQWVAIRHREPLWQTKRRVGKNRTKGMERLVGKNTDEQQNDRDDEKRDKELEVSATAARVEYWEVLSKMGSGLRGLDVHGGEGFSDDEDYVRLEVVIGHDKLLAEGEWDVPLYLDRDWPLSYVDFVEVPDTHWPESVHGQVLSAGRAVDLLTSLRLNSCKNRDRVVVLGSSDLETDVLNILRNGTMADFAKVKLPAGMSLDSLVKVLDFGQGSPESANEREFLMRQMEMATGVSSMLTGTTDNSAVERSATATNTRSNATETRLGDFRQKVEELATDAARKEAIMLRLFVQIEDVAPFVRAADIGMFYVRLTLPGDVEVPVRQPLGPEVKKRMITLQELCPSCSTYYNTPEETLQGCFRLWETLMASTDPEAVAIREGLIAGGIDQTTQLPYGIEVDVVTPERVWFDTSGLTVEEIMRETNYEIASGSGIKFNREAEQRNVAELLQTVLPVMLQNMDYAGANKLLDMRDEAFEVPRDRRIQLTPPPPPPETSSPGGGEGGEKKEKKP